jgi:hypothetical protein
MADETKPHLPRSLTQENTHMMIYMLAIAMTVAMLIATAFGLHHEAERVRVDQRTRNTRFGQRR